MKAVIWGDPPACLTSLRARLSCTHFHKPLSMCLGTPTPDQESSFARLDPAGAGESHMEFSERLPV